MRPDSMQFDKTYDKKGNARIEVKYYDYDGEFLREFFYMNNSSDYRAFYYNFMRMHLRIPEKKVEIRNADDVLANKDLFRVPMFVIARKKTHYWEIREKIFE
jgi:DNA repair protein RadD